MCSSHATHPQTGDGILMFEKQCSSFPVSIFIAGNANLARQICQEYCDRVGFCVTVTETQYVYTNGKEPGVIIGLINYPRFPYTASEIIRRATTLGDMLRDHLGQQSYTIQTPVKTIWRSWREEDN